MNILYLTGGRSVFANSCGRKLTEIVATWRRLGHNVLHVCGGDVIAGQDVGQTDGGAQYHSRWYRKSRLLLPLVHSMAERRDIDHNAVLLDHIEELAGTFSPDLIWERSYRLLDCGLTLAQKLGLPHVLEWKDHLVDYSISLHRSRALRMEDKKNRQCNWMVVESEKLKQDLAREPGVDPEKIIVAHNAVDASQFAPNQQQRQEYRKTLGVTDDRVVAGYLGSYTFYHDARRLVLAARELARHIPEKLLVIMIGDGKEYPECRVLANELKLQHDQFRMLPRVRPDEVNQVLAALDIAILPGSTDIICPIKIQEYMASQTATVAPDYSCNREIITHGVDGLLFQPKDASALADAIQELAGSPELRTDIAARGRTRMIEQFSWDATWGKALETILASSAGNR